MFETQKLLSKGIFHPYSHVCTYAPVHGFLEQASTFGLKPILCRRQSIVWGGVFAIWNFWDTDADLPLFVLHLKLVSPLNQATNVIFKTTKSQGPTLAQIWWFDKLTWQAVTCQVIWGGAGCEGDKPTWQAQLVRFHLFPKHKCRTLPKVIQLQWK